MQNTCRANSRTQICSHLAFSFKLVFSFEFTFSFLGGHFFRASGGKFLDQLSNIAVSFQTLDASPPIFNAYVVTQIRIEFDCTEPSVERSKLTIKKQTHDFTFFSHLCRQEKTVAWTMRT